MHWFQRVLLPRVVFIVFVWVHINSNEYHGFHLIPVKSIIEFIGGEQGRMAVIRLILGVILLVAVITPACTNDPVRGQISLGDRYMRQDQWGDAILAYEKAIAMAPGLERMYSELAVAYNNRGWDYNDNSKWDEAISDFDKAIQYDPTLYIAYNNRGFAYNGRGQQKLSEAYDILDNQGDRDKAVEVIEGAIEEFTKSINDLTESVRLKSDFTEAIDNLAVSYNDLGHSYNLIKLWTEAIAALSESIKLNPELARAYNNRGWAYCGKTEWSNAVPDCTMAIELEPEMELAYNNRGWAYHEMEEYYLALDDLNKAIELAPSLAVAYLNRGITYFYIDNYDLAEADFKKVLKLTRDPELVAGARQGLALVGSVTAEPQ
jgi:tetratricopeptide (TPR) repeat protein